jgi:hypothetical protein
MAQSSLFLSPECAELPFAAPIWILGGPRLDRPIDIQYNTILKLGGPVKNQFLPDNAAMDASNMPLF